MVGGTIYKKETKIMSLIDHAKKEFDVLGWPGDDPLSPLQGLDDEWNDVSDGRHILYQNKRDSEVFKDSKGAYWIYGKIFKDKNGCTYINKDSRVPIKFPWTKPKPEIVEIKK